MTALPNDTETALKPSWRRACTRLLGVSRTSEDRATLLADCRIALCLARGVDPDDIHPAQGWDLSERAYRHVRDSWARIAAEGSTCYRADWARFREEWRRYRPDLIGDWPAWPEDAELIPITFGQGDLFEAAS